MRAAADHAHRNEHPHQRSHPPEQGITGSHAVREPQAPNPSSVVGAGSSASCATPSLLITRPVSVREIRNASEFIARSTLKKLVRASRLVNVAFTSSAWMK